MPQAILMNSFGVREALRSGVEVVAFLGTSLLLQVLQICKEFHTSSCFPSLLAVQLKLTGTSLNSACHNLS